MKRLFRSSCLGLLLISLCGGTAAISVFAIVFQQSQAVSSNVDATATVQSSPTRRPLPPQPFTAVPASPFVTLASEDVIIQIDDMPTTATPVFAGASPPSMTTAIPSATFTSTVTPELTISPEMPRHSGTSSYPLTVTAEVMLAQTQVANYQAGVAAKRTTIAAESISIYGTLTASAPTQTLEAQ